LEPTLAREEWAERLFLDTVCALQAVRLSQLVPVARRLAVGQAVVDILEAANGFFQTHPNRLADAVYQELEATLPELPALRFSNGDLWLDNFIVRDQQLVGVIDFENAGFSDPIFEFLLPFFVAPELRGRGIEERYCRRMGYDPELLFWYRGLEYFDAWHWVVKRGKPFADYTVEKLKAALRRWLDQV
jgi:GNAT superfamily N-acetyltransferase